jgi:hypothetical protein
VVFGAEIAVGHGGGQAVGEFVLRICADSSPGSGTLW